MAVIPYCTLGDCFDVLSLSGLNLRQVDSPPGSAQDGMARSRLDAATKIDFFCLRNYAQQALATSDWVRFCAKWLAGYYFCCRKGNSPPAILKEFYDDIIADLKDVHKGRPIIPDAIPRHAFVPEVDNITWRLRPTMHPRVDAKRSTGPRPTDYRQRDNWADIAQWGVLDYPQ